MKPSWNPAHLRVQEIQHAYQNAGMQGAQIEVQRVDQLKRHPKTGKLPRFVSLD